MIFRKISKIAGTRCQILRLKCTKFDFRSSSTPNPAARWVAYSAPPDPTVLGLFLKKGREKERERKRKGMSRKGTGGKKGKGVMVEKR